MSGNMRRPVFASIASILSLLVFARSAGAVVEQVDGTVLPVYNAGTCPSNGSPTSCVPAALNIGEGLPANSTTNPLNAIFDAATTPEVFAIPKVGTNFGTITVKDLVEGAGFENSFGWYNVDDPDTLYVITPCADEPGSAVRTVNFQTEFTAGRYLGGFIGFFLITPENQPVANNCGSLGDVGHLYYTESARNGDGNYVHYLIYTSKVNSQRFFFGFEDLFRGGDNDFEDMFLQVDGLVVPCVPSAEVCDGADNNCDGLVDNMPVDAGGQCGITDVGECQLGTLQCIMGALQCVGAVNPSPELCDGLDNDCDGVVDDNPFGEGIPCGTNVGACEFGNNQCVGGVFVCIGGIGPSNEVCNDIDDDCNGNVDDNTIDSGGACGSNVGECTPGVFTCVSPGTIQCLGGTGPSPEVCDGLDNDCNGAIDDGDPGGGAMCGTDVGTCKSGIEHCLDGTVQCIGSLGPVAELCDGLDNDCDGNADNLATCPNGSQCVEGNCASPCGSGEFPCPGGQQCVAGFCVSVSCDDVTCDPGFECQNGVCIPEGSTSSGMGGSGPSGTGDTSSVATGSGSGDGVGGGTVTGNTWGLSTGGGGISCSTAMQGSNGEGMAFGGALAIAAAVMRRRKRQPATRSVRTVKGASS